MRSVISAAQMLMVTVIGWPNFDIMQVDFCLILIFICSMWFFITIYFPNLLSTPRHVRMAGGVSNSSQAATG